MFNSLIEEYKQIYPVKSEFHFEYQKNLLSNDKNLFFDTEKKNNSSRLHFEYSFGMSEKEGDLAASDPIEIKLKDGSSILIRGAIDRIDKKEDGRFVLIDYKSGRATNLNVKTPFGGGNFMQAGLYPLIWDKLSKKKNTADFKYLFATNAQGFQETFYNYSNNELAQKFRNLLQAIINQIRNGNFIPVAEDHGQCKYCEFASECIKGKYWLAKRLSFNDSHNDIYRNIRKEIFENE
jgi:CRISPR/Cas system-associated exonuclease Cas4 (RecB family)